MIRAETLGGSIVAIATPYSETGLDIDALHRLCLRQIRSGTSAIVVCGSTGEASALSPVEHALAIRTAVAAANGRVPVIAGCTAAATSVSLSLAAHAAREGADALLCAPPPYVKPTQPGIIAHMRGVAEASNLPLILYDVPSRTGVAIADQTVATLFERGLVVALKDATADLVRPLRLRALCGTALIQLSGDDATAGPYRATGGSGCISVTANLTPALCAALHQAWNSADLEAFVRFQLLLDPLHAALFRESNPIPLKAALEALGLCSGATRLPLTRAGVETRETLQRLLARLMPIEQQMATDTQPMLAH